MKNLNMISKIIFVCITLIVFKSIILTFIYYREVPILINYLKYILIAYMIGFIFTFFKIEFNFYNYSKFVEIGYKLGIELMYYKHSFHIEIMIWNFSFEIIFIWENKGKEK